MPYMWFTCRFYTAVDIELEERPDIVFVTEPYFAEYTIIDPCTDAVQAIGRFRNGTSLAIHVVNANENYPIRTKAGIKEYLKGCRDAYKTIKIFMNVQHLQKAEMLIRLHWIYCHITGC